MHKKIFASLFGIALLAFFMVSCRVIDASTIPQNPKALMGNAAFLEKEITIKKGDKLDLVSTTAAQHVLANGIWDGGSAKPGTEAGAPQINMTVQGNAKGSVGPFTTAGTFNIYCTIHQGMHIKVIVQ